MNLDNCLDKEHEHKSLKQILELPVSALQGLSATADDALKELKVFTIRDFANFKYAAWGKFMPIAFLSLSIAQSNGSRSVTITLNKQLKHWSRWPPSKKQKR